MYKDVGMRFPFVGNCLSHLRYVTSAVDPSVPICNQALTGPDPPHAYNVHPHVSMRLSEITIKHGICDMQVQFSRESENMNMLEQRHIFHCVDKRCTTCGRDIVDFSCDKIGVPLHATNATNRSRLGFVYSIYNVNAVLLPHQED
jgi:hypothetical protein